MKIGGIIGIAVLLGVMFVGLTTIFGSWYTIDQGERGVFLRNGAITGVSEPGLGFKIPVMDEVVKISVQSRAKVYEEVSAYSRDQQEATLRISVNYRLPMGQVAEIYETYGGEEGIVTRLLDRKVYERVKTVFGQFNAVTAIQDRGRLNIEIEKAVLEEIQGPLIVDSVQIEDIAFSLEYEKSIEQRMLAEVEVQKEMQTLERERVQADIKVTQANATADAIRATAQAEADAIRMKGEAEAVAIRVRAESLAENPTLVELVKAENWNGQLPATMVPGAAVPFINIR